MPKKKIAKIINIPEIKVEDLGLYDKTEIVSEGYIVDPSKADASEAELAIAKEFGSEKQDDLLYVAFKLVHVGVNKNKDGFYEDDLIEAKNTPIFKLLNWGHREPNIGVIYASKFIKENEEEPAHLLVAAAVSKFKYPDLAEEIVNRYEAGNLFFSMETWFKEAECSECHELFVQATEYCDHLMGRYEATSSTARYLRGLIFAGAGVVESPADKLALPISIAEEEKGGNEMADRTYTEEEYKALEKELSEAKDSLKELADLQTKLEDEHKEAVEAKDKEIADLTEKVSTLDEVSAKLDEVTKEFDEFKGAIEAEKKLVSRLDELKDLGFELPEEKEASEELITEIKGMSDDEFDRSKRILANVNSKTDEPEPEPEEDESNEDIPIAGIAQGSDSDPVDRVNSSIGKLFAADRARRGR